MAIIIIIIIIIMMMMMMMMIIIIIIIIIIIVALKGVNRDFSYNLLTAPRTVSNTYTLHDPGTILNRIYFRFILLAEMINR